MILSSKNFLLFINTKTHASDFKWLSNSLIDGLPGIACFYAFMNQLFFPNQKLKEFAYSYLMIVIQEVKKNGKDKL